MAAAIKRDPQDTIRHHFDLAARLNELSRQLLGLGVIESFELACEPPVATVGDHRQCDVQIDIQTNFARQVIHVKEVDVRA